MGHISSCQQSYRMAHLQRHDTTLKSMVVIDNIVDGPATDTASTVSIRTHVSLGGSFPLHKSSSNSTWPGHHQTNDLGSLKPGIASTAKKQASNHKLSSWNMAQSRYKQDPRPTFSGTNTSRSGRLRMCVAANGCVGMPAHNTHDKQHKQDSSVTTASSGL